MNGCGMKWVFISLVVGTGFSSQETISISQWKLLKESPALINFVATDNGMALFWGWSWKRIRKK